MERLEKILLRLFFLRLWVTLICVPVAAAGLIYVFALGHQSGVIAYAVYVFSAYALTLLQQRENFSQTKRNEPGSIPSSFECNLIFNFCLNFGVHFR